MFRSLTKFAEKSLGLRISNVSITRIAAEKRARFTDLSPEIRRTIDQVTPFTMTSPERVAALCLAVENVTLNQIPGDFVECGVWKGGSSMAAALTFMRLGGALPDLYLYDTFEGMPEPGIHDLDATTGISAKTLLQQAPQQTDGVLAYSSLDEVRANMASTQYPAQKIHLIRGKVEETIPSQIPEQIALLRLDTDWYESTKHELIHLFPRLAPNGILIIDDYGAWEGARKAVDEYFAHVSPRPFLARIDTTGRLLVNHHAA